MKKFLLITLLVILIGIASLFVYVQFSWEKTFEAPYPEITASTDSAVIAHGEHLVFGAAHCAACHVPMDQLMAVDAGEKMPLSGGWELAIPPGTFRAPNITPDKETGIGNMTDQEIARTIRYGVKSDHSILFPFMSYQGMSDEDLRAIISYLRSQPAISNEVPPSEPSILGKALMAFGLIKPEGPKEAPPQMVKKEVSAAYGEYYTHAIGDCYGCHTMRDLKSGAFIGEPFGGGMIFGPDPFTEGYSYVSPNLTPDPETGWISAWSEQAFVNRMTGGRVHPTSPMPWGLLQNLDSVEVHAIYAYLQSLDPVSNKIEKVVYKPGEEAPKP